MALDTRHVHLLSPLPPDQLLLQRVEATERLGRPFRYELELLSPDPSLKIDDLLGDKMGFAVTLPDGDRFFNGHVARIGQAGAVGRYTRYTATLRPFLWLLTRASDSRIFKKLTVPDIVKHVLSEFGFGDVEMNLHGTYPSREYTVQYRETCFDFLSRLLEEEGIYYYFRHEKNHHFMVLCDDRASHAQVPSYEKVPFVDPEENAHPREEHFSEWTVEHEVQTGAFAVNDFDFEVPRADLLAKKSRGLPHKHAGLEKYDPIAGFVESVDAGNDGDGNRGDRGELFARVRLEELQAEHDRVEGLGNARGLFAGSLFELTGHPRGDQNRELLIIKAEYRMFQPGFDAGSAAGREQKRDRQSEDEEEHLFELSIVAQPSKVPFRPRRITPLPVITGPHAAVVVGSGEIWTDKYGRVKLHFPWDREDTEGCWVRVAQVWAGSGWGGLQVPRVGQEVIVEFVGGDPDRPIITGRVYNGSNPPPFGLPDGATKSGILTRSSKGGSADNANEIRFEDKKGDEQLFLHAEKHMDTEVEQDQTLWVGRDRKNLVDNDQSEEIKGNKTIKVHKDHKEDIAQNMKLRVDGSEEETIGGSRTIAVLGSHTETIAGVQGVTVGLSGAWSVGGNGAITFGGTGALSVGGNHTEEVGGNLNFSVAEDASVGIGKNMNAEVAKNLGMKVGEALTLAVTKDATVRIDGAHKLTVKKAIGVEGKEITIEAKDKLTLKAGSATITLNSNGNIEIKGNKINVKGDSDVVLKGSKIAEN